jgi:branched-chain amino acid transport system permease protein
VSFWFITALNGLSLAMLLFILSAGLTLAFGLMQVINIAHGSFYLLAGYIALSVMQATQSFTLALVTACVAVMLLGAVVQRTMLSRLHRQELPQSLLTLGLLFVLADLCFWIWGGNPQLLPMPSLLEGSVPVGPVRFPLYRLSLILMGVLVALGLWLFLERTRVGAVIRAGMDDEEMVRGMGIDLPRIFTGVFALGAALAALGGVLGAPLLGVFPGADFEIVLLAFAVVTIGGLGSVKGAFIASLVVGLVDNVGTSLFPQFSLFSIVVPMVIVLAWKPTGLVVR